MSSVTSVLASPSNGARFFVAVVAAAPIYNASGAQSGTTMAINTVVRDMGKTIRTPSADAVGAVTTQLVLRKVAIAASGATAGLVNGVASSFVGFSEGNQPSNIGAVVFYINLYDGKWASISL